MAGVVVLACAPGVEPAGGGGPAGRPLVGVVMGSDSDLPVLAEAVSTLEEFGVPCEVRVMSAHRTPADVAAWAAGAAAHGLRVLIAAAGGAAHLAGVVAAHTVLPVIGVPVAGRVLDGLDSLLAMAQMPPGVPVGVVGVNGARNAALLAVAVLATADPDLRRRLEDFRARQAEAVRERDRRLTGIGTREYLRQMGGGPGSPAAPGEGSMGAAAGGRGVHPASSAGDGGKAL